MASPCLGMCDLAPAVFLQLAAGGEDRAIGCAEPDTVVSGLVGQTPAFDKGDSSDPHISVGGPLLSRVGEVDPSSLSDYRAAGGYAALAKAFTLDRDAAINEIIVSGLTGRGGAAYPTGLKWRAVADATGPRLVVANGDESEPGTFKDRVLMEEDPFAVIEAMTIAGWAVGAEQGYVYVRGEYPLATRRLADAIDQARADGLLGDDVLGRGVVFDIELRRGAGAYICGEETALFNSIEGYRGEPRSKPPYPTERGLFGQPTLVNNIETLVNVLPIINEGGEAFATTGVPGSTGTKLFCLSGSVKHPGLYELAFGATLRELLGRAGGVKGGRRVQAILVGGAAGSFVDPANLDVPLTFAGLSEIGASLGSGAIVVFDDTVEMPAIVRRIAEFFRDESCGQCVPCRVGTVRQEEALQSLIGGPPAGQIGLLSEIAAVMGDGSICGLGQTAASAVQSAVALGSGGWCSVSDIAITVDGVPVVAPAGSTLLEACRQEGFDVPTLCFLENLTPANTCRICVVEVEGSRALVPACSRQIEPGMVVHIESERVRHTRKVVLELLGSSVDLSLLPISGLMERYGARPDRFEGGATVEEPATIDNQLFVRDYAKCILCYKCVQACGVDAQNTFAISVAGRGFEARISTEYQVSLPDSACVFCGNCFAVCPTGALIPTTEYEMREQAPGTRTPNR